MTLFYLQIFLQVRSDGLRSGVTRVWIGGKVREETAQWFMCRAPHSERWSVIRIEMFVVNFPLDDMAGVAIGENRVRIL